MRAYLLFGCLIAPAFVLPGQADAQIRINGRVIENETLEPIPAVDVRVSTPRGKMIGRAVTDREGRFRFDVEEHAGYVFHASRIGYEATETPTLWTDGFRHYEVEIRLDPEAVLLAPIEVVARSRRYSSPVIANFRDRLSAGLGHYFTREDIERLRPGRVTDLVARVPGVQLLSSGPGITRQVIIGRAGDGCLAEIFVDGFQLTPSDYAEGISMDEAVAPADVLGIEVYRGLSTVPAEFLTRRARCGVVAIWTRR